MPPVVAEALVVHIGLMADGPAACDPSRDVRLSGGMAFFDARTKAGGVGGFARRWPNVAASSPETIARVDDRWAEYGLGEFVESPSLRYLKLQERPGAEF